MGKKGKGKGKKKERRRALLQTAAHAAPSSALVAPDKSAMAGTIAEAERPMAGASEIAARLAGLSTVLQRHLARADAGEGLTRARLSALGLLVMGGPRRLGELATAEHVRPPTMTRMIHAMEADGLVVREPDPDDGRSVVIRATERGEARLEEGRRRQIAPLAESISDLDRDERLQLELATDLLGRLLRTSAWEPVESSD